MGITLKMVAAIAAVLVVFSAQGHSTERRGFGAETATGYQVDDVKYWTGPDGFVESVEFRLDAPARDVSTLIRSDGTWLACARAGSELEWTCPLDGPPLHINDADTFQVRAL